jgi:hypothetical protein
MQIKINSISFNYFKWNSFYHKIKLIFFFAILHNPLEHKMDYQLVLNQKVTLNLSLIKNLNKLNLK